MTYNPEIQIAPYYEDVVQQGSTWTRALEFSEDISMYNFRGQIRKSFKNREILANFVFSIIANNEVEFSLSANTTQHLPAKKLKFDIEMYTNDFVARIVEGILTVTPEVTR
jgi:hypothetical protein